MTYATDLGYKIGDRFKIKPKKLANYLWTVTDGYLDSITDEFILDRDDGSGCPLFKARSKSKSFAISLESVEKLPQPANNNVIKVRCLETQKTSTYSITKGRIYDASEYDSSHYKIKDDEDRTTYWYKDQFEIVEDENIPVDTIKLHVDLTNLQEMKKLLLEIEEIHNRIFK